MLLFLGVGYLFVGVTCLALRSKLIAEAKRYDKQLFYKKQGYYFPSDLRNWR